MEPTLRSAQVLKQEAEDIGFEGKDILEYVKEQQKLDREERAAWREDRKRADESEEKKRADEIKIQIAKIQADKELALKEMELQEQARQAQVTASSATTPPPRNKDAKSPKLPSFIDEKDELDSYLLRFERYAENASWEKDTWAIKLSALLTGRAMDVYTRMSDADASDYDKLKKALYVGEFYKKNGLLYRKHQETKTGRSFNQLVVPKELRRQVMSVNHESAFSGHLGAKKTEVRILPNFFWPGLRQDVIRFCRSCDVCQRTVKRGSVKKVPLGSMPLIDTPFKRVAVDIVGPIAPPSEAGHRYILTLVDYATRYPEAVPLKKITTEAVAEALLDIYSRVGIPEEVLTDQGTQFMSECMQEVSRLLSIKGLTSTPYHPICNGLVERWNGTLKSMLKRLCQDQPKQWHRLINPVLFAYREVPQESTGFSPFQLLYGRAVRGPGTILKELWTKEVNIPEVKSSYEYVTELRERLEDSLKLAQEELEKSQKRYKRYYDRKAKPRRLEVGDRVLILLPTDSNKLLMQWRGPYTVESRVGANDYRVKMGSKMKTYHVNMLKKYISREPEGNVVPVDDTDGATIAVAGVIHQDVDPELGEVPDLEGDVKLGDELPEDQRRVLKDLVRRYPDVFTDMPGD